MKAELVWVDAADCHSFHEELLARFGGLAGVRDEGLLDSALNRPIQLFNYGDPSIFEMAAAYASGIVKNHPFLDGNKRSGFMAATLFLESNGHQFIAPEIEVVERTLALAASAIGDAEYAEWLERSCAETLPPEEAPSG
jgi:death-on-curing protein